VIIPDLAILLSMNTASHEDTIIALATPQGTGALAVIRLSGKEAIKIAGQLFQ
jgi:tRNA modification GTPase